MSVSFKDNDKGWKDIKKELKKADKSFVNVGVLSDAGNYAGEKGNINLADVATFNEFGTSRIPSRPFMRQAFDKNVGELKKILEAKKDEILARKSTTKQALEFVGNIYTGMVEDIFVTGEFKENSIRTKFLKNHRHIEKAKKLIERESKRKKPNDKNADKLKAAHETVSTGGKTTPLIDTGRLRQSINYEVKIKGK